MAHDWSASRRAPSKVSRVCLLVGIFILSGCQHYGLAGRPSGESNGTDEPPTITVSTVATPAHWSINGPRLTRELVEALKQRGLEARWDGSTSGIASLRCSASTPPVHSYRGHVVAEARMTCQLRLPEGASERLSSHAEVAGGRSTRRSLDVFEMTEWLGENAVLEALRQLVPSIVDRLRDVESRGQEASFSRQLENSRSASPK